MTDSTLPRIIRFDGLSDSGEYGADNCAHCGAKGRYQYHFIVEGGQKRAAMAGCINLFPVSKLAGIHAKLLKKADEYSKKGWNLPSWDRDKVAAIGSFYAGTKTEDETLFAILCADSNARNYRANKKGR